MIYLVRAGDYYKIGFTNSLVRRLTDLQVSNPYAIDLIDVWPGDRDDEACLHDALSASMVRGEWFDLGADDLAWLAVRAEAAKDKRKIVVDGVVRLRDFRCVLCGRGMYYENEEVWCECDGIRDSAGYHSNRGKTLRRALAKAHKDSALDLRMVRQEAPDGKR